MTTTEARDAVASHAAILEADLHNTELRYWWAENRQRDDLPEVEAEYRAAFLARWNIVYQETWITPPGGRHRHLVVGLETSAAGGGILPELRAVDQEGVTRLFANWEVAAGPGISKPRIEGLRCGWCNGETDRDGDCGRCPTS